MVNFRNLDSESPLQPFGHQSAMTANVEALPAEHDGAVAQVIDDFRGIDLSELCPESSVERGPCAVRSLFTAVSIAGVGASTS
jgi:hypothetical protein